MRISTLALPAARSCLLLAGALFALSGCGGGEELVKQESFSFDNAAQFSKKIQGPGNVVCWSVKRAFFSQGYMLDRSSDTVFTGTKEFQHDEDTNVTLRLQTACTDNRDGTSTVFATASREVSKLQSAKQHRSAGIGWATITVPAGSEKALRVIERKTIQDPKFYEQFYALVQNYAATEASNARRSERSQQEAPQQ